MKKLINISNLSKILNLVDPITNKPQNHILRYWEREFKQIKPKKINNQRYYSNKQVEIIKTIKFLLKDKGMTIIGVKKLLHVSINELDVDIKDSLNTDYYKIFLQRKSKSILKKLKNIKNYGKKNSS